MCRFKDEEEDGASTSVCVDSGYLWWRDVCFEMSVC